MGKITFFLGCFFYLSTVFGSQELQNSIERLKYLTNLTDSLVTVKDCNTDVLLAYINEGVFLAGKTKQYKYIPKLYDNLAYAFKQKRLYEEAIFYSKKASLIAKKGSYKEEQALSGHTLAIIYTDMGKLNLSLKQIYENLGFAEKHCLNYYMYANYILLSDISESSGNSTVAEYYLQKSYEYNSDKKQKIQFKLESTFTKLVNEGKLREAEKTEAEIQKTFSYPISIDEMFILTGMGKTYLNANQPDKALKLFFQALEHKDNNSTLYPIAALKTYISTSYIKLNNINKAEKWNKEAAAESKGLINGYEDYLSLLKNKAQILTTKSQYRSAAYVWEKVKLIEDSISQKRNEVSIHFSDILRKSEHIEKENQKIIFENRLRKAQMEKERQQILILTGFVIVLIISVMIVIYLLRKLNKSARQISKQKLLLMEQTASLKESNNVKDKLFSLISHELRSPIAGFISILRVKNAFNKPQDIVNYFDSVRIQAETLYHTLDNLLHWSSSQLEMGELRLYTFDFQNVVSDILDLLAKNITDKQITVINQVQPFMIKSNEGQLFIVVRNILANALKFTPSGGVIRISNISENGLNGIIVQDSGSGFSKEVLKTVFSKVQKSGLGTEGEKGTGLGLMLCKGILDKLNGKIIIESQQNIGSSVAVLLPVL